MILVPIKEMNLENSMLSISGAIIKILGKATLMPYEEIIEFLEKKFPFASYAQLTNSILFLYTLGKINYFKEKDLIELIKNET